MLQRAGRTPTLRGRFCGGGEPAEAPAVGRADGGEHLLPALAVTVDVPVLQRDAGGVRALGGEGDLDLARLREIGLDLPGGSDVPAEHDPVRRLVGQHAGPAALTAVLADV